MFQLFTYHLLATQRQAKGRDFEYLTKKVYLKSCSKGDLITLPYPIKKMLVFLSFSK